MLCRRRGYSDFDGVRFGGQHGKKILVGPVIPKGQDEVGTESLQEMEGGPSLVDACILDLDDLGALLNPQVKIRGKGRQHVRQVPCSATRYRESRPSHCSMLNRSLPLMTTTRFRSSSDSACRILRSSLSGAAEGDAIELIRTSFFAVGVYEEGFCMSRGV